MRHQNQKFHKTKTSVVFFFPMPYSGTDERLRSLGAREMAAGMMPPKILHLSNPVNANSLLLATSAGIGLLLAGGDLAQHDHAVTIHESHTGQTFAVLEA